MDYNNTKVFFITGCSKGFGLTLTEQLLEKGYYVASTSRYKEEELNKIINDKLVNKENFLPLQVDLTCENSVKIAVSKTLEKFGRIDVLINNAAYTQAGAVEELTMDEIKESYNVNVFGMINVVKQIVPYFRNSKESLKRIMIFSSMVGFVGSFSGYSTYIGTKFAVEGFTESFRAEVAELGISVVSVVPGYFRTRLLDPVSTRMPSKVIEDYKSVRGIIEYHEKVSNGNQPGDPVKACKLVIEESLSNNPKKHLYLGTDCASMISNKIKEVETEIKENYDQIISTDYETKK